jgi:hypothetical protein
MCVFFLVHASRFNWSWTWESLSPRFIYHPLVMDSRFCLRQPNQMMESFPISLGNTVEMFRTKELSQLLHSDSGTWFHTIIISRWSHFWPWQITSVSGQSGPWGISGFAGISTTSPSLNTLHSRE